MNGYFTGVILPMDLEIIIEPRHEFSNNMVCATKKGSDQPVHTRSLIRAYARRLNNIYPTKKETHHLELFNSQEDHK